MPARKITEIDDSRYRRSHGHAPQGRDAFGFRLVADSVTYKDHIFHSDPDTPWPKALARAQQLAALRRAVKIVVLP